MERSPVIDATKRLVDGMIPMGTSRWTGKSKTCRDDYEPSLVTHDLLDAAIVPSKKQSFFNVGYTEIQRIKDR